MNQDILVCDICQENSPNSIYNEMCSLKNDFEYLTSTLIHVNIYTLVS